jgi:hypothetical protein
VCRCCRTGSKMRRKKRGWRLRESGMGSVRICWAGERSTCFERGYWDFDRLLLYVPMHVCLSCLSTVHNLLCACYSWFSYIPSVRTVFRFSKWHTFSFTKHLLYSKLVMIMTLALPCVQKRRLRRSSITGSSEALASPITFVQSEIRPRK